MEATEIKSLISSISAIIMVLLWVASGISVCFGFVADRKIGNKLESGTHSGFQALFREKEKAANHWIRAYAFLGVGIGFLLLALCFGSPYLNGSG